MHVEEPQHSVHNGPLGRPRLFELPLDVRVQDSASPSSVVLVTVVDTGAAKMRGQFNASLSVQVQELKRTMQNRDKRRSSDQRHRRVRTRSMQAICKHTPLSFAELELLSAGRRG
jgi:hypothetical protein